MSVTQSMVTFLNGTTTITNLIGNRSYPNYTKIADKTYPLVVYKTSDVSTITTYDAGVDPLQSCQLVFHCIGKKYADADAVCTAICNTFDGFKGTWGTMTIQGCFLNEDGIQDDVELEEVTEEIIFHIKEITMTCLYVNQ